MTSERTADAETVREALHVLTAISFDEDVEMDIATLHESSLEAYAALDRLVAQHRDEEYREGMVTVRGHDQAHLGCMGTETWQWLIDHPEMDAPALDRLVAQLRDTQEALALGARYAEGVMLREADPFLRDIHQENLDKIRAALASVRARSDTTCECGHAKASHAGLEFGHGDCEATVYTNAPLGGGGVYPCPCKDYQAVRARTP